MLKWKLQSQLIILFWKLRRGKTATILSNNTKYIILVLRPSQTKSPTTAVIPQNINQYRAQNMTKSPAAAELGIKEEQDYNIAGSIRMREHNTSES